MTNEINIQAAASQRPASGATKAREAVASEQTAKPDPKPKNEVSAKTEGGKALSSEQLDQAVQRLNDLAQSVRRELSFSLDKDTGRTVITVKDTETDQVVRMIPSEEILALISRLEDSESGLLQEIV